MNDISSRTPEGRPNRCPVCRHKLKISPSWPTDDAPCPRCGSLVWFPSKPKAVRAERASSEITLDEYLEQLERGLRLHRAGHIPLPGFAETDPAFETECGRLIGMLTAMTPEERKQPALLIGDRRQRVAQISGVSVEEIHEFLELFRKMQEVRRSFGKRASVTGF